MSLIPETQEIWGFLIYLECMDARSSRFVKKHNSTFLLFYREFTWERDRTWINCLGMISEEVRAQIAKYDQTHILKYYDAGELNEEEEKNLEEQVALLSSSM